MTNAYVTHVVATTANGIEIVDPVDYPEADWLSFAEFYNLLRALGDDEQIFCSVDPDQEDELREEYGIN